LSNPLDPARRAKPLAVRRRRRDTPSSGTLVPYVRSMFRAARVPALARRRRYAPKQVPLISASLKAAMLGWAILRCYASATLTPPAIELPTKVGSSPHLRQRRSTIRRQAMYSIAALCRSYRAGMIVYFGKPRSIEFF